MIPLDNTGTWQTFLPVELSAMFRVVWRPPSQRRIAMAESRNANPDLNRAFSDAKKQAGNVASEVQDGPEDLYGQARDSAAVCASDPNTQRPTSAAAIVATRAQRSPVPFA